MRFFGKRKDVATLRFTYDIEGSPEEQAHKLAALIIEHLQHEQLPKGHGAIVDYDIAPEFRGVFVGKLLTVLVDCGYQVIVRAVEDKPLNIRVADSSS